jgi:hypothetical protein
MKVKKLAVSKSRSQLHSANHAVTRSSSVAWR